MPAISLARFRELVSEALDGLPGEWAERLDNVAVVVEEEASAEELASVGINPSTGTELLGLYQGVPLDARSVFYSALPDRIVIYRGPILRAARTRQDILRVIRETVLHELGHHFGLQEEDLPF